MTIKELLTKLEELRASKKHACTLLGIGPMSEPVLRATFELGKEKGFPIMLIASRNQIDSYELGGGYVKGWDQEKFVAAVRNIADETGFDGLYYICRDHGGPWQRDNERADKLPEKDAMDLGKKSYLADLIAGFDLIHIDPTKDPHCDGVLPMDTVIRRTVELIEYIENERVQRNLPPVDYEVGTEETNGGLTTTDAYTEFIKKLTSILNEKNLPSPAFIVAQTGTLVRLTENVGNFNTDAAAVLSANAREYNVGIKEHNADYLSDEILLLHPAMGVTAANVAPEFGVVETETYLLLAEIEKSAFSHGLLKNTSDFISTIRHAAVDCQRWRKWMMGDIPSMSVSDVKKDSSLVDVITNSSGHYTFEEENVAQELNILKNNLTSLGMDFDRIVLERIKASINRYVMCFGLNDIISMIDG